MFTLSFNDVICHAPLIPFYFSSADIRRQKREADEQADFIRAHKEARKRQEMMRRREQEEDLKQLRSYNPFGKPGYGAPRVGHVTKIRTQGAYSSDLTLNRPLWDTASRSMQRVMG